MKLLKIDYDQEEACTSRTPTSVFRWMQENNGSIAQTVLKQEEVTIKREATYEFKWDRAAKVSGKISFHMFNKRIPKNYLDRYFKMLLTQVFNKDIS